MWQRIFFFFFFSSRRRHTRLQGDWSSDVCSPDLAQVAKSYFALRAFDEQLAMTRRNVSLREDALVLQRKRYNGGVISEYDLRQLEAETASVRAQLPPLERSRDQEEAALTVLLGRSPKLIYEAGVSRAQIFDD